MKFNKLFAAGLLASIGATAAYAGNVTLVGFIDEGVQFTKAKHNPATTSIVSDVPDGNRIILRGIEDINADYHIGFALINKFDTSTGDAGNSEKAFMFTNLFVVTPIGRIGAGRLSTFGSGVSPIQEWVDMDPFGGGWGDAGVQSTYDNMYANVLNNTVYYMSTPVAGIRMGLLYSNSSTDFDGDDDNYKFSDNTQTYELFLAYEDGPLAIKFDGLTRKYGSNSNFKGMDTPIWLKAAARYTLPSATTLYVGAGWSKNMVRYNTGSMFDSTVNPAPYIPFKNAGREGKGIDSYSANFGLAQGLAGGTLLAQYQFQIGKNHFVTDGKQSYGRHVFGLGYKYPLSKRTDVYAGASYSMTTGLLKDTDLNRYMIMTGMAHRF